MGFDELSQTSLRNNRSLLRSTLNKYFRTVKKLPVNDKTELSVGRLKHADTKRRAVINTFYVLLIFCLMIMIAGLMYFL